MTRRRIVPSELLEAARQLVSTGPGKPRTTLLRRATSTAYYAIFHEVTWHSAQWMLPEAWRPGQAEVVSRWYSHTSLDRASRLVSQISSAPAVDRRGHSQKLFPGTIPSDLITIATAVSSLQQRREAADYDHGADVTKAATLADIDRAEAAVQAAERLWRASDPHYGNFLLLVLADPLVKSRGSS